MVTSVLLAFADGRKEFIDDAHIHGCRDGKLLIATGIPGAGMDAEVIRTVAVAELKFAETCEIDDTADADPDAQTGWHIGWSKRA
jgi:hypothetical protein